MPECTKQKAEIRACPPPRALLPYRSLLSDLFGFASKATGELELHSLRFSSIEPAHCSWQPIHTTRHERITAFALHKQLPSTFADTQSRAA
jgi:hypothetical protein